MARRVVQLKLLPQAMAMSWVHVCLASAFLYLFSLWWQFIVIDMNQDLGNYGQMTVLGIFFARAFPMNDTNNVSFEYNFTHVLLMAIVQGMMYLKFTQTTTDIMTEGEAKKDKDKKKKKK